MIINILLLISLILVALTAIGYIYVIRWRIFTKARKPGWISIIPIYNAYTVLKIVGRPGWWLILLCVPVVDIFIVYTICQDTARCFGRSEYFGDGLFFLFPIFGGILAFGGTEYIGHTPHRGFYAVFKRELKSYFTTPLAYVFLVIFLFFSGYLPFRQGFFEMRQANMSAFFVNIPLLLVFMVPSAAMRLWAEERKVGSIELLFTLPITIRQAVLGKFLAAWLFLGIALILTFPMVITVCYLGSPDIGVILTSYLGSFLMAGGFLAIGCFFSAMSKSQVIAFVLSVVACGILLFAGMPSTMNYLSSFSSVGWLFVVRGLVPTNNPAYFILLTLGWITTFLILPYIVLHYISILVGIVLHYISMIVGGGGAVGDMLRLMMESMSIQNHFDSMQRGVLTFFDISYFVLLIAGWVAACCIVLNERKAK